MAGTYALTIDLDDACSTFPPLARHRVYSATLEDRGWHFLVVGVVGGGFSEQTQIGDLFSGELSPVYKADPRLRWNTFDLGCDVKEQLADSTRSVSVEGGKHNRRSWSDTVTEPSSRRHGPAPEADGHVPWILRQPADLQIVARHPRPSTSCEGERRVS